MHTILVIEDDHDIRVIVRSAFEKEGFTVLSATDGQSGMDLLQRTQPAPCLVILDLMMPIMGGVDFLNQKKTLPPALASIPVIVVSGKGTVPDDEQVVMNLGKPVNLKKLLKAISLHCPLH